MAKCEVQFDKNGSQAKVKITGIIDEDVQLTDYSLKGLSLVEINLDHVRSINSCGVREWVKWLESAPSAQIKLVACPKVIIDQINLVAGFLPLNAKVQSFYVPYFNPDTDFEKIVLFREGVEFAGTQVNLPKAITDDKGNELEIDVVESKYFGFLKSA